MKKTLRPVSAKAQIARPEIVLQAAQAAPRVFSIAQYFSALHVMREKGYSWRYLADWLKSFNISVSYVHLHRLYEKEDARLSRLSREELLALGMPTAMVDEYEAKADPAKRLTAPDAEDEEGDSP